MNTEELASPPDVSAGQQLRQAREARGWAVSHVAGRLRIRPALVEALERDDYTPFGAVTYARGQMRNYAELLGVDAASVLQGVSVPRLDEPGKLARNAPELHPRRPWLVRLGGAAVVLVLAVLGALWADANRERAPGVPPPVVSPDGVQASASADSPGDVSPTQPPAAVAVLPAEPATPPSTASAADVESPPQPDAPQPAEAPAEVSAAPVAAPALAAAPVEQSVVAVPDGLAELRIQTRSVSWVEVSDGSGQRLIYELLSPGREQAVRGVPPLRLLLGNAPAVEVIYNGAPVTLPAGEHVVRMTLGSAPPTVPAPPAPQP